MKDSSHPSISQNKTSFTFSPRGGCLWPPVCRRSGGGQTSVQKRWDLVFFVGDIKCFPDELMSQWVNQECGIHSLFPWRSHFPVDKPGSVASIPQQRYREIKEMSRPEISQTLAWPPPHLSASGCTSSQGRKISHTSPSAGNGWSELSFPDKSQARLCTEWECLFGRGKKS